MSTPVRVWAPTASQVTLASPGVVHPLSAAGAGWWQGPPLSHGQDYAFHLDDGPARPDPRSAWQPAGVHGPSRHFDAARHHWQDQAWQGRAARGAVTYELHVGTFTPQGDLDGAITRLPHLAWLGVEMVELMPLAAFDGHHGWGYDGVGLWAVHHPYGGPAALQRFVDAAHRHGIGVCLDVVYNHCGPTGNYLPEFGPYFTTEHSTPWGHAINLDAPGSDQVRAFIIEAALRWMRDFHVDALRLDAVHTLVDTSKRHLLAELSDAVAQLEVDLARPLSLVAESDLNDPKTVAPTSQGGQGMSAQWDDDVHHALHSMLTGERQGYYVDFGDAATFADAVSQVFVHNGTYSTFRGQTWGAPVEKAITNDHFVVFSANHDQVGNRALGDRPGGRCNTPAADLRPLAAAAALVLASPFTPMLFMGEEWGATSPFQYFTDHTDPELGAAVTAGRKREFGTHGWAQLYGEDVEIPDPQESETFLRSHLDWDELAGSDHQRLLTWHRDLIALRAHEPALTTAERDFTGVKVDPQGTWVVLERFGPGAASVGVVVNLSDETALVPVAASEVLLSFDDEQTLAVSPGRVQVPPRGVALLRLTSRMGSD